MIQKHKKLKSLFSMSSTTNENSVSNQLGVWVVALYCLYVISKCTCPWPPFSRGKDRDKKKREKMKKKKKNSGRAWTVPCRIQVLCRKRDLDWCHEGAGQKTARGKTFPLLRTLTAVLRIYFIYSPMIKKKSGDLLLMRCFGLSGVLNWSWWKLCSSFTL